MRVVPISLVVVFGLGLLLLPATEMLPANAASAVAAPAVHESTSLGNFRTLLQDPHEAAELSFSAPTTARGLLGAR
jgi:hypothetical protein